MENDIKRCKLQMIMSHVHEEFHVPKTNETMTTDAFTFCNHGNLSDLEISGIIQELWKDLNPSHDVEWSETKQYFESRDKGLTESPCTNPGNERESLCTDCDETVLLSLSRKHVKQEQRTMKTILNIQEVTDDTKELPFIMEQTNIENEPTTHTGMQLNEELNVQNKRKIFMIGTEGNELGENELNGQMKIDPTKNVSPGSSAQRYIQLGIKLKRPCTEMSGVQENVDKKPVSDKSEEQYFKNVKSVEEEKMVLDSDDDSKDTIFYEEILDEPLRTVYSPSDEVDGDVSLDFWPDTTPGQKTDEKFDHMCSSIEEDTNSDSATILRKITPDRELSYSSSLESDEMICFDFIETFKAEIVKECTKSPSSEEDDFIVVD